MRVLHVIHTTDQRGGGPIEAIRQIADAITPLGHSVEVACCDAPESPWLGDFPVKVHALGPGSGRYGYTKKLLPWLLQHADEFDAVVANGIWQYTSFCTWRAMKRLGKPYVVFTHGMLDPWFKNAYPLKHLKKSLYWPWAEYRVLRDAAAVLFTSESERLLARQSFRLYRARERVIHYGTAGVPSGPDRQREAFFRRFPGLRGERFLLFLGRIHAKKGCDLLIRGFAKVCRADTSLKLVFAGPDQVGLRAELERLASSLNVADRVLWTDMLTGDEKWGAMHACEAFVLPSHQENFGIAVAEALSCGRPVMISNQVNIWREISDCRAGIVADDTDAGVESLLTYWRELPEHDRDAMALRARECFEMHFEITNAAKELISVLEGLSVSGRPTPELVTREESGLPNEQFDSGLTPTR